MAVAVTDDRGAELCFDEAPRRIVSLVPSDTYTLVRLGVGERLVGRTDYCVEPASELSRVPTVGGTKNVDVDRVVALDPDLVVANQEENRKVDIERLADRGIAVLISFPKTVREGLVQARRLAALLPDEDHGELLVEAEAVWTSLSRREVEPLRCFVPIWMDPLMTVHGDTFISDVVELVGGTNVFSDRERRYPLGADLGRREPLPPDRIRGRDTRYPRVTLEEVERRRPELVLLPDEPHEFTQRDAEVFRALDIPAAAEGVVFCDGKDLMWYGLRALEGAGRLRALLDDQVARLRSG
jgi:ABC-type Fe3+-hydroxamate transport system substrate-binding protein